MFRTALCLASLLSAVISFAHGPEDSLPESQYERNLSDPLWLRQVARFHGHLGPMVVVGARMGMAGVHAVDAKGYFDVEVTCEGPFAKPPASCFLDGVQVATGATLGKRSINTVEAEKIVLRIRNTQTGKTAEVRPTQKLLDVLASLREKVGGSENQQDDEQTRRRRDEQRVVETARAIAVMQDEDILTITQP